MTQDIRSFVCGLHRSDNGVDGLDGPNKIFDFFIEFVVLSVCWYSSRWQSRRLIGYKHSRSILSLSSPQQFLHNLNLIRCPSVPILST